MKRKLVAAIACRNQGSRLYGKPLQNLDIENGINILDHIVASLQKINCIDEIVLGISESVENDIFKEYSQERGLRYIVGDQIDVLSRLIQCGQLSKATDIFRISSESPFLYFEPVEELWSTHKNDQNDATFMDDIVDGCGFEILSLKALEVSHLKGEDKHRSELCTLYIREHYQDFKINKACPPKELLRKDLRLTVDYPEDLVVCRTVFEKFKHLSPKIPVNEIIKFLDLNPKLIELTAPYTEIGYESMFRWGNEKGKSQ